MGIIAGQFSYTSINNILRHTNTNTHTHTHIRRVHDTRIMTCFSPWELIQQNRLTVAASNPSFFIWTLWKCERRNNKSGKK